MLRALSCLLLLITAIQGIDVIQSQDIKGDQRGHHPEEILPAEVWESILDYLPVLGQATLAAVHPFFRDDFFWERRFRLSFPGLPLPTTNIKSLCRYVLVIQAIDRKFRDPMAITLTPQTYNWILETTFIAPVADQLKEYVAKINEARQLLEERARTIEPLAGNHPGLSRAELFRLYYETFSQEGDEYCKFQLRCHERELHLTNFYFSQQDINSQQEIMHYLEYWTSKGDEFALSLLCGAALSMQVNFNLETGRSYLYEHLGKGNHKAQSYVSEAALIGNYYGMECIFTNFTEKERKEYLEDRAYKGDQHAQERLNYAAAAEMLEFTSRTGRAYLEERILKGDHNAQEELCNAAYWGNLGFTPETGRIYLMDRAYKGDQHAQLKLNEAAYEEILGFTTETGKKYLEDQMAKGDSEAENLLCGAAGQLKLGFTEYTGQQYLQNLATYGSRLAQKWLYIVASIGSLDFNGKSGTDYLLEQTKKRDAYALLNLYSIQCLKKLTEEQFLCEDENYDHATDEFLRLIELDDTFQRIKTKEIDNQIGFAGFMTGLKPIHAIPLRWFFSFFNTLLGRNNENA